MPSSIQPDNLDLVRLIGRTIFGISLLLAVLIFLLVGVESGGWKTVPWNPVGISTALAFLITGGFAWGALRGLAQIRDHVENT